MRALLLSALLTIAIPAALVDAQTSCLIVGEGAPGDRERAERACEEAASRFGRLFGLPAPVALIDISDTLRVYGVHSVEESWVIHWPSTGRLVDIYADPGLIDEGWSQKLPHELGHLMLYGVAVEEGIRPAAGEYSSALPDWLDEGVAGWMELGDNATSAEAFDPPAGRKATVREIVEWKQPHLASDDWIRSLARTVALPCPAEDRCYRPRWRETMTVTQRLEAGQMVADTVYAARLPAAAHVLDEHFGFYSRALVQFVYERGGNGVMSSIIDRLVEGAAPFDALIGLPAMPATVEALEGEWSTWLASLTPAPRR